MTTPVVSVPVSDILSRLAAIPLDQSPFPHLVLDQVVPAECFSALLEILPALPFTPAEYPGTGRFTARHGGLLTPDQTLTHVGMVLQDWNASPLTAAIHAFLSGAAFSRMLLDRFSDPRSRGGAGPAIPIEKHKWFRGGDDDYTVVFELYKDRRGYEVSPHVDNPAKIVTFVWYVDDDSRDPCGTMLCRPSGDAPPASLDHSYDLARHEGRSGLWMDWKCFDVVRHVRGPNVLFAFAPNDMSYHAVRVPGGPDRRDRVVIRGFIARSGYRDTTRLGALSKSRRE